MTPRDNAGGSRWPWPRLPGRSTAPARRSTAPADRSTAPVEAPEPVGARVRGTAGGSLFAAASGFAVLAAALGAVLAALAVPVPAAAAERTLFPDTYLYRPAIASQYRPGFGVVLMAADAGSGEGGAGHGGGDEAGGDEAGIADAGSPRFLLRLGGRFGLLRWAPEGYRREADAAPWALQLSLAAGFRGQFDVDNSLDNIGWDGNYGLLVSGRAGPRWSFKTGLYHVSAHVGDEYAERTGRRRRGYTREEVVAAVAYQVRPEWRLYVEGGYGHDLGAAGMEPGRLQAGIEYEGPPRLLDGRAGWFAALDLSAFEENGWGVNPSLQAGLTFPGRERRWRAGILAYDGRVPLGEFFEDEETYLGVGLWLDV